jgi:hypothetical protein
MLGNVGMYGGMHVELHIFLQFHEISIYEVT